MKILILGGTRFLGRHLATEVLARGHELALFDPDRSDLASGEERETLADLEQLRGREWDACIDTSTRGAQHSRDVATSLRGRIGRYVYISSIDAHLDDRPGAGEGVELRGHGAAKREVEATLRELLGETLTILRPSLIVGPHDHSGRFSYWATRALGGGEFLAPGPSDVAVPLIDVRDAARFALDVVERELPGEYDLTGSESPTTFGELLDALVRTADELSSVTWVDNGFLLDEGVRPWVDIPLWLTEEGPRSVRSISGDAARAAGFHTRPLEETLRDTLTWLHESGRNGSLSAHFLDRGRERELLSRWHRDAGLARQPLGAGHEI